jgi:hypothetical protein
MGQCDHKHQYATLPSDAHMQYYFHGFNAGQYPSFSQRLLSTLNGPPPHALRVSCYHGITKIHGVILMAQVPTQDSVNFFPSFSPPTTPKFK